MIMIKIKNKKYYIYNFIYLCLLFLETLYIKTQFDCLLKWLFNVRARNLVLTLKLIAFFPVPQNLWNIDRNQNWKVLCL